MDVARSTRMSNSHDLEGIVGGVIKIGAFLSCVRSPCDRNAMTMRGDSVRPSSWAGTNEKDTLKGRTSVYTYFRMYYRSMVRGMSPQGLNYVNNAAHSCRVTKVHRSYRSRSTLDPFDNAARPSVFSFWTMPYACSLSRPPSHRFAVNIF